MVPGFGRIYSKRTQASLYMLKLKHSLALLAPDLAVGQ